MAFGNYEKDREVKVLVGTTQCFLFLKGSAVSIYPAAATDLLTKIKLRKDQMGFIH